MDDPVGHRRQKKGGPHGEKGDGHAEAHGDAETVQINRIAEQADEILEPNERAREAESILDQHRLVERLAGRPDKEYQRDDDLRRNQQIG